MFNTKLVPFLSKQTFLITHNQNGQVLLPLSLLTNKRNRTNGANPIVAKANDMPIQDGKPVQESRSPGQGSSSIQKVTLPDFMDPRIAYRSKTLSELLRAYLVFRLCSYDWLVDHQSTVSCTLCYTL